ncbi:MAG: transporter [Myxococcota bacterium]|nr:transporter [Myxococcota bacterium]
MRAPFAGLLVLLPLSAFAHQPVQDMAPRWSDGWGLQVRQEYRASDKLLSGSSEVANPRDRMDRVSETWLEGVYTFRREVRVTAKLPWIQQTRVASTGTRQKGEGFGDLVLAVPLKRYWNEKGETGSFGFTPHLRLPTGSTSDAYPVGDGSYDVGASFSYVYETPLLYVYGDLFSWLNGSGRRGMNPGNVVGLDLNLGLHPYHDNATESGVFLMWDVSARYEGRGTSTVGTTGGKRISTGPVAIAYWQNWMLRAEYAWPAYEKVWDTQVSRGVEFTLSLGAAY